MEPKYRITNELIKPAKKFFKMAKLLPRCILFIVVSK